MGSKLSAEERAEFDELAQTEDWLRGNEEWFKRNREFARQCVSGNRAVKTYLSAVMEADRRSAIAREQWTAADHAMQRQWEIDERAREAEGVRRARELAAQLNVGLCDRCGVHDVRSQENLCPKCLAPCLKRRAADRASTRHRLGVASLVALLLAFVLFWFGLGVVNTLVVLVALLLALVLAGKAGLFGPSARV
jgi:Flp pilus assembly protein TadB